MEVLAALVILGIIFIGIMLIFPQMTLFNAKTETKLDTMNLANQEMAIIENADKWVNLLNPDYLAEWRITEEMKVIGYTKDLESADPDYIRYHKTDSFLYEVDFYLQCEPFSPGNIAEETEGAEQCAESESIKLYKVHLKVYDDTKVSSETFSYVAYTVESPGE